MLECASDSTISLGVAFIGTCLDKASKASVSDLLTLIQDVLKFLGELPPDEVQCTQQDPEFLSILPLYNIDLNNFAATERKLAIYVTLHFLAVHKWLVDCDDTWNAGKYYDTGFKGAGYLHQALGLSEELLAKAERFKTAAKELIHKIKQ